MAETPDHKRRVEVRVGRTLDALRDFMISEFSDVIHDDSVAMIAELHEELRLCQQKLARSEKNLVFEVNERRDAVAQKNKIAAKIPAMRQHIRKFLEAKRQLNASASVAGGGAPAAEVVKQYAKAEDNMRRIANEVDE